MKKAIRSISALLACLLLALSALAACNADDTPDATSDNGTTTTAKPSLNIPMPEPADLSLLDMRNYVSVNYKSIPLYVEELPQKITDDDAVADIISAMAESGDYSLLSEGTVKIGDRLEIAFVGTMNGEEFSGGTSEKSLILVDTENSGYITGFADVLIGKNVGDTVGADLTFPDNYYAELAGKAVHFDITVKGICTFDITDEIAQKYTDNACQTKDELIKYVREYLEEDARTDLLNEVYDQIWDELTKRVEIKGYVEEQNKFYYDLYLKQLREAAYEDDVELDDYLAEIEKTYDDVTEESKKSTLSDMILYFIASEEELSVSDEEYREALQNYVDYYNSYGYSFTLESLEAEFDASYYPGYFRQYLLEEKVIDRITDYSLIEKAPQTSEDVS